MRTLGLILFGTLPLLGQAAPAPATVLRGTVVECDKDAPGGQLSVRAAGDQVYRFAFDSETYFERESRRVLPGGLVKGDTVEIVSDRGPAAWLRYARTVHVIEPQLPPRVVRRHWPLYPVMESIIPRGDLTFAGVVARLNNERLVLRTRERGEVTILLREDTKYLDAGSPVDLAGLRPNTRVFVRGGKNLYDELEAYQVVWGAILDPDR